MNPWLNRLRRVVDDPPDTLVLYVDSWLLYAMFGLNLELVGYFERWCSVSIDVWAEAFHCGFMLFIRGPTSRQNLAVAMFHWRIRQLIPRRLLASVIARDLQGSIRTSRSFI